MPELPDITVYVERLDALVKGETLVRVRLRSSFVLRSVDPGIDELEGRGVESVSRLGKRIVLEFDGEMFLVIHLMIAGRLRWRDPDTPIPKRRGLAAFDFPTGTLLFTEEGTKKRASIHVVGDAASLVERVSAVHASGRHSTDSQCVDLVLHQRDQGGDDDSQPIGADGGGLKTE